jgi:hypothetical protein
VRSYPRTPGSRAPASVEKIVHALRQIPVGAGSRAKQSKQRIAAYAVDALRAPDEDAPIAVNAAPADAGGFALPKAP